MVPAIQHHQQSARHTKSASKGNMMMSPYTNKTGKQQASSKEPQVRGGYRMQTMTAQKASTGNNLLCSSVKPSSSKGKFELPMLSNRSNSKQTLGATRNMSQNGKQVTSTSLSSSHNYLPSKITSQPLQKPVQMPPTIMSNSASAWTSCKPSTDVFRLLVGE